MSTCEQVRAGFSQSLDGTLTGREMQHLQEHTRQCAECRHEFAEWRQMHQALGSLGQVAAPYDLDLRLRLAISNAQAEARRRRLDRWEMLWQNTVRPLALQGSAGLATAMALIAAIGLLFGMFAAPQRVQASSANDEPMGMATPAHFLYSAVPTTTLATTENSAVVVQVFVGADGRVYDYKVLGGEDTPGLRAQLNNVLYFAVFSPARVFGKPVRGTAVLSYAGVAVHG